MDFFALNAHNLSTLHFVEVEDLHIDDLQLTVGECVNLERFVMQASSIYFFYPTCPTIYSSSISPAELLDAASGPSLALLDSQAKAALSKRGPPAALRPKHPSTAAHGVHLFLQGATGEFHHNFHDLAVF